MPEQLQKLYDTKVPESGWNFVSMWQSEMKCENWWQPEPRRGGEG